MESVLKDLYRKQSHFQPERSEFALDLLNDKIERKLSHYNKWATSPDAKVVGLQGRKGSVKKEGSVESQIQDFGSKVATVPGFEDLEGKQHPVEIVFWSIILFVLIGLTGYSFIHLTMNYLANPTTTNVQMQYSPYTILPSATLCIPFHIDRVPFAGKTLADSVYPWKEAADLLETLNTNQQHLNSIFSCPHDAGPKNVTKRSLKARLINEYGKLSTAYGRVEIALDEVWGTVCSNHWNKENAKVVCRMVTGHESKEATTLHVIQGGQYPDIVWMDNVNCTGSEDNIGNCLHSGWAEADCTEMDYAAVDCTGRANPNAWEPNPSEALHIEQTKSYKPINLGIRLRNENGATNQKWGTVEISYHGVWGTISDQMWGQNEASVVCTMLDWPEGSGVAFVGSTFGPGHGPTLLTNVQCTGNETNIGGCSYQLSSEKRYGHMAGVDCTGEANSDVRLIEKSKNHSISKTAAALLSRINAIETWKLVNGETPTSFKWSSSRAYPAGNLHKERAIQRLLVLMDNSGHVGDLSALQSLFGCGLCDTVKLGLYLQLDKYTRRMQNVFQCRESVISWVEDSVGSHRVCFRLPLDEKTKDIRKGTFMLSLDLGKLYDSVDWSNETVRELYSDDFKLDLSGSINADKETVETVALGPGEEQTITVDTTANYITEKDDCNQDFENCELKCIAAEFQKTCSHRCIPFTWQKLMMVEGNKSHCLLDDYRECYRHVDDVPTVISSCSDKCKQPCKHMTYSVRTLFKKALTNAHSETRLFIKMDSEVFPEFAEEPVMNWYQLMGDLGGVIGLWLGASFVGVLHFFEFVILDIIGARKLRTLAAK